MNLFITYVVGCFAGALSVITFISIRNSSKRNVETLKAYTKNAERLNMPATEEKRKGNYEIISICPKLKGYVEKLTETGLKRPYVAHYGDDKDVCKTFEDAERVIMEWFEPILFKVYVDLRNKLNDSQGEV